MNDLNDIFVHTEGAERAAYQAGREIARMTSMGYERFVLALFQWMRQHGPRPIWSVDDAGAIVPDTKLQKDIDAYHVKS